MDEVQGFNEDSAERAVCTGCAGPLLRRPRSGGWRHELGVSAGACADPVPMVPVLGAWVN